MYYYSSMRIIYGNIMKMIVYKMKKKNKEKFGTDSYSRTS